MQPEITVGIIFAKEFSFVLKGKYKSKKTGIVYQGEGSAVYCKDTVKIMINNSLLEEKLPIEFIPIDYQFACFELKNVTIGINFHWERKENQLFKGALKIIKENNCLTVINCLQIEDYLESVISSEMSAKSSPQLLRAHAIISRSWLLAQKKKKKCGTEKWIKGSAQNCQQEKIKWYDREDHENFDVCADDHCQRYQGMTKATDKEVKKAVVETKGEVLVYNNEICDARYSKACGGITELYENVWEPVNHPYLDKVIDAETKIEYNLDLTDEKQAYEWIMKKPEVFCNTKNKKILKGVLNDYDQETTDFFRWKVVIEQKELKKLLKKKINIELGNIVDLLPVERGVSGRLIRLKIVGTKGVITIGKELEIRKALSESHLYSSAFIVEKSKNENIPSYFTLYGAGWGHGVGLCQIGAAVMGEKGYSYQQILKHYFKKSTLEKWY